MASLDSLASRVGRETHALRCLVLVFLAVAGCRDGSTDGVSEIQGRLDQVSVLFQQALPEKTDVMSFFDAGSYYHNGLGLDPYLDEVLLKPRNNSQAFDYVGFTISDLRKEKEVDADHIVVTYKINVTHPSGDRSVSFPPWEERTLMARSQGQWRIAGNQQIARANANFLARLAPKPLSLAELQARSDVFTVPQPWDPLQRDAYFMKIPDPANPGTTVDAWLGFPGDDAFGVMAWGPTGPLYLATPDARVRVYMVFEVSSTEIDPRVAYVHVTGPGLPPVGLNLVRSDPGHPRDSLIFRGDPWLWNTFDNGRCSIISKLTADQDDPRDYIPNCALDWSQIESGSSFLYSFRDEDDVTLGEMTLPLQGDLIGEAGWYAARDQYFGHFTLDPAFTFTYEHVTDPTPGSPFAAGGTVELKWQLPTGASVQFEGVTYWRQYTDSSMNTSRDEHHFQLYGTQVTSVSATSDPVALPTGWAYATVVSRDAFGNWFDQEVSPNDPY